MRGDHHHLTGREVQGLRGREIDAWLRLVVARDLGAQDHVPGNVVPARDVDHQRNVAVRAGRQYEFAAEAGETGRHVGPCIEAVPREIQIIRDFVVELFETETRADLIEHAAVQDIELHEWLAARPHFLHAWLVQPAPSIGELEPIDVVAERLENPLRVARNAVAPIDDGAEYVEDERLDGGYGRRLSGRSRKALAYGECGGESACAAKNATARNFFRFASLGTAQRSIAPRFAAAKGRGIRQAALRRGFTFGRAFLLTSHRSYCACRFTQARARWQRPRTGASPYPGLPASAH